jgi:hypothetical protein
MIRLILRSPISMLRSPTRVADKVNYKVADVDAKVVGEVYYNP